MKRKVITISIAEDVIRVLDFALRAHNMSRSRYIENLLIDSLDNDTLGIEYREDNKDE